MATLRCWCRCWGLPSSLLFCRVVKRDHFLLLLLQLRRFASILIFILLLCHTLPLFFSLYPRWSLLSIIRAAEALFCCWDEVSRRCCLAAFANIFHSGALYRLQSECVSYLHWGEEDWDWDRERERRTQTTALAYLLIRPAKTREWFGFSREWLLLLLLISLQADSTLNCCCCCSSLNFTPHCLANGRALLRTTSIIALDNNHWLSLSLLPQLGSFARPFTDRLAWPASLAIFFTS